MTTRMSLSPSSSVTSDSAKRKRTGDTEYGDGISGYDSSSVDGNSNNDGGVRRSLVNIYRRSVCDAIKHPTVYGPELPPSMARNKAVNDSMRINSTDFSDIAGLLREESRSDASKSEYMKRTEQELQSLFHAHLTSIMSQHGYKGGPFTEKYVSQILVKAGVMHSASDDPVVALATYLRQDMIKVVHKNMRMMASSVMVPEFFDDISVDPIVIDTLVDLSRQGPDGSKQAASVVAVAAAAAIADADADFEDALRSLDAMTLVQTFDLGGICKSQQTSALPAVSPAPAGKGTTKATEAEAKAPATASASQKSAATAATAQNAPTSGQRVSTRSSPSTAVAAAAATLGTSAATAATSASVSTASVLADRTLSATANMSSTRLARKMASDKGKQRDLGSANGSRLPKPLTQTMRQGESAMLDANSKHSKVPSNVQKPIKSKTSMPPPPPPVRSSLCKAALSATTANCEHRLDTPAGADVSHPNLTDKLWSSDSIEEQRQVRAYWLGLSDIERQSLILVEKEVVLARVRDHQNFSCSCNVCSRKRKAIELELDSLYDCYFNELQESARRERMRISVREAEKKARANVLSSVESIARSMMNQLKIKPKPEIRKKIQNRIIENIRQTHFSVNMPNKGLDLPDDLSDDSRAFANETADAIAKSAAVILGRPSSGKHVSAFETTVLSMKEWADGAFEYQQEFGDEPFQSEAEEEENFNNNDLFYTEDMLDTIDTFPTDSKKFFDMMEKLAEYRMRREDAIIDAIEIDQPTVLELIKAASASSAASEKGIDSITQSLMRRARDSMHPQRRCPDCHGEISDAEDKADGSESFQNPQAIKSSRVHSDLGSSGAKDSKSSVYYDLGDSEYEDGTDDDNPESDVYSDSDDYEKYEVYSDGSISEDDECDEDDDYDDDYDRDKAEEDLAILDSLDADHEAEESRKVFQLFAARLFEQRVINAYRENIAHNRQEDLIKELEEEEKQQQAKEKRKQRKKEREKEKKRQLQLKKQEERLAKEAELKAEQERAREIEQKKNTEILQKRREQELKAKKAQEDRNRRILEEADRRMEKERQEKLRLEQEKFEKEQKKREAQQRYEQQQQEQKRQELQQQQQKQKQRQKQKQKPKDATPTKKPAVNSPHPVPDSKATALAPNGTAARALPISRAVSHAAPASVSVSDPAPVTTSEQAPASVSALASGSAPKPDTLSAPVAATVPPPTSVPVSIPVSIPTPAFVESAFNLSSGQSPTTAHRLLPTSSTETAINPAAFATDNIANSEFMHGLVQQPSSPGFAALNAPRPSLPLISQLTLGSSSPSTLSFGAPPPFSSPARGRARANSSSNVYPPLFSSATPLQGLASDTSAVSPEIDAEIMSIVGRVMGATTLQDDLIGGAEWRAEPSTDSYRQPESQFLSSATSAGTLAGLNGSFNGSLSDAPIRRNSVPLNRFGVSDTGAIAGLDADIETIQSAYWALERFRRGVRSASATALGADMFGGYHSVAEIAKMQNKVKEPNMWSICVNYAQNNPGFCRVNHSGRSVAFARLGGAGGMPPTTPTAPEAPGSLSAKAFVTTPGSATHGSSTSLGHLTAISEDMMSAFRLQPHGNSGTSPLLSNGIPRGGPLSYGQPRSPLMPSQQQAQSQIQPQQNHVHPLHQLNSTLISSMAPPSMSLHSIDGQMGMSYSPVRPHGSPSSQMFFNSAMGVHPTAASHSFQPQQQPLGQGFGLPFAHQQPGMASSWSPSKPRLASVIGGGAGGDDGSLRMPSLAPMAPMTAQFHQMHMFSSPQQQQQQQQQHSNFETHHR